jgi:hypothetical protein
MKNTVNTKRFFKNISIDYIVFSDDMTNTLLYDIDELYADALSDDDIIEYLIYTGVEIEELY